MSNHHHFIHYKHHHLHHRPNSYLMIISGILIQVLSVLISDDYISTIVFLFSILILMMGLFLLKHTKKVYLNPVTLVVVLMMFASIGFAVMETLLATIIYLIYSIYLFLIFDVKKIHMGIRK